MLGQVLAVRRLQVAIPGPMNDESRYLDSRENVPDITPEHHVEDGSGHGRAQGMPSGTFEPLPITLVVNRAWSEHRDSKLDLSPFPLNGGIETVDGTRGEAPLAEWFGSNPGCGIHKDER